MVNINTFDLKRVLIDLGSFSEIMYHNTFDKLKILASQIRSAEVPVGLGHVQKTVEFIVMNIDSPDNAILGRG